MTDKEYDAYLKEQGVSKGDIEQMKAAAGDKLDQEHKERINATDEVLRRLEEKLDTESDEPSSAPDDLVAAIENLQNEQKAMLRRIHMLEGATGDEPEEHEWLDGAYPPEPLDFWTVERMRQMTAIEDGLSRLEAQMLAQAAKYRTVEAEIDGMRTLHTLMSRLYNQATKESPLRISQLQREVRQRDDQIERQRQHIETLRGRLREFLPEDKNPDKPPTGPSNAELAS